MAGGGALPVPIDALRAAHRHSSQHREAVLASELCACFYCLAHFAPGEIEEWVDGEQTALCPRCGVDAVLGSASPYPLTSGFLRQMHDFWFSVSND
jgi:hypothetical protein